MTSPIIKNFTPRVMLEGYSNKNTRKNLVYIMGIKVKVKHIATYDKNS